MEKRTFGLFCLPFILSIFFGCGQEHRTERLNGSDSNQGDLSEEQEMKAFGFTEEDGYIDEQALENEMQQEFEIVPADAMRFVKKVCGLFKRDLHFLNVLINVRGSQLKQVKNTKVKNQLKNQVNNVRRQIQEIRKVTNSECNGNP